MTRWILLELEDFFKTGWNESVQSVEFTCCTYFDREFIMDLSQFVVVGHFEVCLIHVKSNFNIECINRSSWKEHKDWCSILESSKIIKAKAGRVVYNGDMVTTELKWKLRMFKNPVNSLSSFLSLGGVKVGSINH